MKAEADRRGEKKLVGWEKKNRRAANFSRGKRASGSEISPPTNPYGSPPYFLLNLIPQ